MKTRIMCELNRFKLCNTGKELFQANVIINDTESSSETINFSLPKTAIENCIIKRFSNIR